MILGNVIVEKLCRSVIMVNVGDVIPGNIVAA